MNTSSSSQNATFTAAVGQWSSLSNSEQRTILNYLIDRVRQVFSDRELRIPDASFLEFAIRAGLHNFQMTSYPRYAKQARIGARRLANLVGLVG